MVSDPVDQWQLLKRQHPAAARLAIVSSLPVRVSPALLRLARLRLVEDATTGNEADLWLSDLVEVRSTGGFSFRPEVRTFLRQRLAEDVSLLDRVWQEVHQHLAGWLTAKARLEEEQTWRLLRDPRDPWIDENWRLVWNELQQSENAEGVARWVVRAMTNLPSRAMESEIANRVWVGAHLLLGDTSILGSQPQQFLQTGEFDFATRRLSRRRIQVGLVKGGVIISPVRRLENGHALDVPFTRPLWMQIEDPSGDVLRVLTITGSEPVLGAIDAPEFVLRLIDGSAYRLAEPRQPRSDKFIQRNRAPRIAINYEIETYGAVKRIELPFVTGVLADLSGNSAEPLQPVNERKFVDIDRDNFDAVLEALRPRLDLAVANWRGEEEIRVELEFRTMDDFSADRVVERLLSPETLSAVLHHEAFQRLEGSWRGLHYLVNNTETDETLKIRVLNISKRELSRMLRKYAAGDWNQSPLFKKLYTEPYGQPGGEPYGCLVGDYQFDNNPADTELLGALARICAVIHAPFIAGASPAIMGMSSWQELGLPRDLQKLFSTPDYLRWQSLRESEDSRYIALTLPRFLARLPYGSSTRPLRNLESYEEPVGESDKDYTWCNAAYAMAVNISRAFKIYGWCARIRGVESGGVVENMPVYTFPTDSGGIDMKSPTEVSISDRREAELEKLGFLPLVHAPGSDMAVFVGAQSLHQPLEYDSTEASANAVIAARLPYILVCGRFAHYLMSMVRDSIGSFKEIRELEQRLNHWIDQYVDPNPSSSTSELRSRKPLADGHLALEPYQGEPGFMKAALYLRPSFQFEGLTTAMRLVVTLPHP